MVGVISEDSFNELFQVASDKGNSCVIFGGLECKEMFGCRCRAGQDLKITNENLLDSFFINKMKNITCFVKGIKKRSMLDSLYYYRITSIEVISN